MSIPSTPDTIIWRLHLSSPPERVYEMLATDAGRERFWAERAVERDGAIDFEFINGVKTTSRIIDRDAPNTFIIDYFNSRVDIRLSPDGHGGTDLTLTNSGFAPEDRDDILPGWLNVLFPLKAAVDFDVDLRSHDPTRTWQHGYIDQ